MPFVKLPTTTPGYQGLSTDIKPPLSASDALPAPGSVFLETDSQRLFRWDGTQWVELAPASVELAPVLAACLEPVLKELRTIRRGIELAINHEIPDTGES